MGVDDSQQRWQYKVVVRPPSYNCIKEKDTPLTVLTALPLHRIFKAQFHTIAVGVSVRGILKKKAIKHGGCTRESTRGVAEEPPGGREKKCTRPKMAARRNCKVEAAGR